MDHSGLVGIYLAAGKSSRMGTSKLNLPLGDMFVGSMGFQAALQANLDVTIAVTRRGDPLHWLAPFLKRKEWRLVECQEADDGQSNSLKAGVNEALKIGAIGAVVLLADQPYVTVEMINGLVEEFVSNPQYAYVSYLHEGVAKPPILIGCSLFSEVGELKGDQGARRIIRGGSKSEGKVLPHKNELSFFDVDTIEDYYRLIEAWENIN